MFGVFRAPPSFVGFQFFEVEGFILKRVIGRGGQSVVFEVCDAASNSQYVMKIFLKEEEYHAEMAILTFLKQDLVISQSMALVPYDITPIEAVDSVSEAKFKGIVSLPICQAIRPTCDGVMLSRSNRCELLETIRAVHLISVVNGDIKPSNVLVDKDLRAVICDWGSAVILTNESAVTTVGTVGFSDFCMTIGGAVPLYKHDLKALVRTIYCNYTEQVVSATTLLESNQFWAERFVVGSIWAEMMAAAEVLDYDTLAGLFDRL